MLGIYTWVLILLCAQESFARRADIDSVVDELEADEEEDGRPPPMMQRLSAKFSSKKNLTQKATGASAAAAAAPPRLPRSFSFKKQSSMEKLQDNKEVLILKEVVTKLRTPEYTLQDFHNDMVRAFGEFELSLFQESSADAGKSGIPVHAEYQRTLGAFYAVYCLLRLDDKLGGKQVFIWGSDFEKTGFPQKPADKEGKEKFEKKQGFHTYMTTAQGELGTPWDQIEDAVYKSGILDRHTKELNEEKTVAMLVLTAIHDVMKMQHLWPTVGAGDDGPAEAGQQMQEIDYLTGTRKVAARDYRSVKSGERIEEHDAAIEYELTHILVEAPKKKSKSKPAVNDLPTGNLYPRRPTTAKMFNCFDKLSLFQQFMITFTQGCPNIGWLNQGEAPPGHLFTHSKQKLLAAKEAAGANPQKQGFTTGKQGINFYIVHWWTDLAGGLNYPDPSTKPGLPLWPGAEKMSVAFIPKVVDGWLKTLPFVQNLDDQPEAAIMKSYLDFRWEFDFKQPATAAPSIALRRLTMHAPTKQLLVVKAYKQLEKPDQDMLAREMGLTGTKFDYDMKKYKEVVQGSAVCSFLLYYGPEFLRFGEAGEAEVLRTAMRILAAIYKAARELWPIEPARTFDSEGIPDESTQVIITLKHFKAEFPAYQALQPKVLLPTAIGNDLSNWLLVRTTDVSGMVVKKEKLQALHPELKRADQRQLTYCT